MAVILVEKDALSGPTPIDVFARLAAQVEELDPGEIASKILRFGYGKAVNDKKVPDPVGSGFIFRHFGVNCARS